MSIIPTNYYEVLAGIESGNNPLAKNPRSSASGLYQFTKGTFTGLGYNWSDRFDVGIQNEAIQKLTTQNANILQRNGINIDGGSLYAAHFLGADTAVKVLGSANSSDLASLVGNAVMKANPQLAGYSVGDFKDWLAKKTTGVGGVLNSLGVGSGDIGLGSVADALGLDGLAEGIGKVKDTAGTIVAAGSALLQGDIVGAASAAMGEDNILEKFLKWLKELFSVNTAARFAAIIVGVILIAAALFALVMSSDTAKQVASKAVALAA